MFAALLTLWAWASAAQPPQPAPLELFYTQPAKVWTQAIPLGNGRLGAMVFGKTADERIALNEDTFWAGGPYDPSNPQALEALPQARTLIFEGKYKEAHNLVNKKMMATPLKQMPYQPIGDLKLTLAGHESATDYRRSLDLRTAISTVRYKIGDVTFTREMYISPVDQVMVIRLTADRPAQVSFGATLTSPQKSNITAEADELVLAGIAPDANGIKGVTTFQARLKVITQGGQKQIQQNAIAVTNADAATLLLAIGTSYVNYKDVTGDPAARTRKHLAAASAKPLPKLREDHVAEHRRLMDRVELDLGPGTTDIPTDLRIKAFGPKDPQLAALYFQFARYLAICSSRPGTQPGNLQGIWNDSPNPPWDSKYTININTEMNYWPIEVANLAECHQPLFDMVRDISRTGAKTAKTNWGAGGWVCHHNTDLWRATAPIDGATWGFWPTGGAWLTLHLWEHYKFNGDLEFLRKNWPILKGASQFFLDTLVEHPARKWLVTCPSISPENTHPQGVSVCAGPTMDQQIIRDLFDATMEASRLLKVDDDFARKVEAARRRLAPSHIGAQGQLQEWLEDWDAKAPEREHRHVSHLYGVFPSAQINHMHTPELFAAARKSLEIRGDGGTGWSKGWKVNLWARFLDGDHSYKMLASLIATGTYPNMFDAHPPFQIDGNFGGASGIAEMLLQSHLGQLHLLPALPSAWPAGSARGLRARGGFELEITWKEGKLATVSILSTLGGPATVRFGDKTVQIPTEKGKTYRLGASLQSLN